MPVFRLVPSSPTRSPSIPRRAAVQRLAMASLAACALALPLSAAAQGHPQVAGGKPIRILVGAPAGGTTDTLARTIAQEMSQELGQPVVVENRPGAGGNIAADLVAKSAPDGSTLLMSFTSHTINATLYKKLPFDPVQDFTPITLVATVPSVLVATPKLAASNVPELIRLARSEPGKLNFAIGSVGSSLHMAGDMFKMMTGTYIVNIPYKGTAPALTDVLAGQCDLMFASTINVLPHVRAGKLKVLGVTSPAPLPQFPGAAPIGATVKGFESSAWFGLFGPAGMPHDVTQALYQAARKGLETPAVRKRLENDGAQPMGTTPEAFAAFVKQDVKRWAAVVKYSGASPE
ncbi:extra-cytoplasmic solute receptor [Cupriavidus necator N-1]|jgi:tripartite-type tricarboxylate transporter receptor subunit TctC|uniref:Extra-cytoplasmic solute receptor n=1 Tax=Cupriavidus necator (strain ATCC 43291 / DSM 13513 / CCUG 52238 / LMG 8453 / N-1) TaxID=1042878 RepID=F8GMY5_CUPNN|nr:MULTISPECIES: tripartite tricarboxylate transporter substrate binding protein [Cupriavidus]AEI79039.1 extra-cytoplasmic solute receptor [Cupriavidus necator N-1]KAI3596909.1 BUG/TctC family periplasmic protein [Cupriavidus necator H850]MDX6008909.1 tripartite tricarboxylate transporter substrate binding protein [Cupriavidus necator]QUN26077.1 tripartite tricarboxylate transporter substrate binding protein [Cupriavidus sp. KK10]